MAATAFRALIKSKHFLRPYRMNQCENVGRGLSKSKWKCVGAQPRVQTCSLADSWSGDSGRNSARAPRYLIAGILSYLGLEKEKEDPLIHTIKLAILSIQKGELNKAEQILHLALRMAQEKGDEDGITYIYDIMSNVAYEKGEFKKAEKLFVETMKRLLQAGKSKTDNALVEISLKLAQIFSSYGDAKKAETGFRFCIDTQLKKLEGKQKVDIDEDTIALWAMSMDMYARHLMKNQRFAEARANFEQALQVSTQINGETHPQTIVLLNDLGSICCLMNEFDSALEHLQKAVQLGIQTKSFELPAFYCNMGIAYLQKGDMSAAKDACETASSLAKKNGNKEAATEAKKCLVDVHNETQSYKA